MKRKNIIEIDYNELEQLVCKSYDLPYNQNNYCFVSTEECGNDSSHKFDVSSVQPLDKWQQESVDLAMQGQAPKYSNHAIMQDLVNKGILEPAEYIVQVCW